MAGDAVFRMSTRAHTPPTPVGRWCGRVLHVLSQKQVPLRSELGRASAVLGGLDSRDASWNAAVCVDLGARVQNCPSYGSALALPPIRLPGCQARNIRKDITVLGLSGVVSQDHHLLISFFLLVI